VFLQRLQQRQANGLNADNWGLGNSEVFTRWQAWQSGRRAMSLDGFAALPSVYARAADPRAGRNNYDLGAAINIGQGFTLWRSEHFLAARAAYRHRLGILRDQVQLEARTGLRFGEDWMLLPELFLTVPMGGVGPNFSVAGQNDYRLLKGQLSAVYFLRDNTGLQVGIFRHLSGDNTGTGGGALLSLWRRF
jgi:hypothetical protein